MGEVINFCLNNGEKQFIAVRIASQLFFFLILVICHYFIDHQHIVAGKLGIIKKNRLRKLFTIDPEYRENNNISREKAKSSIIEGLNNGIDVWFKKNGVDKSSLKEWKYKTMLSSLSKVKLTFKCIELIIKLFLMALSL